jgi:hypothetical protein
MPLRLSLSFVLGVLGVAIMSTASAAANCEPDDFICRKFSSAPNSKPTRTRRPPTRSRSIPRPSTPAVADPPALKTREEREDQVRTTMAGPIVLSPTPVQVTTLAPGSIEDAPKDLSTLVFSSNERIEAATAICRPAKHSLRRVDCTVAMHRLALTSGSGDGCLATLKVRNAEFAKDASGRWRNEEAIALCGGRLIRETELFPVAVNGEPQFALRERYEMLGGNRKCAAPYLATRRPLERTFMPNVQERAHRLACGTVTAH